MNKLREWTWPEPKTYNGFTGQERIRGWKLTWWLRDIGILTKSPTECSICGGKDQVNYHNENYYTPESVEAICKPCHFIIHGRFKKPEPFHDLVKQYGVGDKACAWFTKLSFEPFDMAEDLRQKFGAGVMDLVQGLRDRGIISNDCKLPEGDL